EDAVRNAKAAVEEGIVAGGGVALLQASKAAFDGLKLEGDEATGANIVKVAVEAPLKQIAINSGLEGGVVVEKVKSLPEGHGLNAASGEYEDLVAAGVIDPAKVTRSALQNAASIAGLFLTTEAVVADKPETEKAGAADPTGGMGGMDCCRTPASATVKVEPQERPGCRAPGPFACVRNGRLARGSAVRVAAHPARLRQAASVRPRQAASPRRGSPRRTRLARAGRLGSLGAACSTCSVEATARLARGSAVRVAAPPARLQQAASVRPRQAASPRLGSPRRTRLARAGRLCSLGAACSTSPVGATARLSRSRPPRLTRSVRRRTPT